MTRKSTNFNLDKAIDRISKPSIFDRIVKEVDAKEIPVEYIEKMLVQYHDGHVVELSGNELTHPVPLNRTTSKDILDESFKKIRDVKIYINTDKLETYINVLVEKYLGKWC